MSLQHDYRPKSFKTFVGNKSTIESIQSVIKKNPPRAFLITGNSGCGKCVSDDTYIFSELGMKTIKSFAPNAPLGFSDLQISVASKNEIDTTSHFYKEENCETKKIVTEYGYGVTGTYKHPVLVYDVDKAEHVYKHLKDVKTTDYTCINRDINLFSKSNSPLYFSYVKDKMDGNGHTFRSPCEVNCALSAILGYLIANGSQNKNKNKSSGFLFSSNSSKIQADFVNKCDELHVDGCTTSVSNSNSNICGVCRVSNTQFATFINTLFKTGFQTARYKVVPNCILESKKEMQRIFLRTLFDCDSYFSGMVFEYYTASEVLAKQVHLILLNFGIVSKLKPKTDVKIKTKVYDHTYWTVAVGSQNLDFLWKTILFDSLKYDKLKKVIRNPNNDIIPNLGLYIKTYISKYLKVNKSGKFKIGGKYFSNKLFVGANIYDGMTFERLEKLIDNFSKMPELKELSILKQQLSDIYTNHYYYDKIKTISEDKKQTVYDFTIPKTHSFIGGGIVNHNSTLSYIIAKALGCSKMDFVKKDASSDRTIAGIKKLKEDCQFLPMVGKKKVFLLEEFNNVPKISQQALLDTLENPPKHVHFIICTTNPENLLDTVVRRCHNYKLLPLKDAQVRKNILLRTIKKEKVTTVPDTVLDKIIDLSDGSPGIALKYLDLVIDQTDEKKAISVLQSAGADNTEIIEICRVLCQFQMSAKNRWYKLKNLLKKFDGDPESSRRAVLGYLTKVILNSDEEDVVFMAEKFEKNFFDSGKNGFIIACKKAVMEISE